MNNLSIRLFMTAALVCGIFFLTNCAGDAAKTTTPNKPADAPKTDAPKNDAPKTDAPKTDAPKSDVASTESVGVPECDEFLKKWEACVSSKVPEAQRSMYKSSFDTTRKSWKDMAANPQTKASLASACKQSQESTKQALSSYSCEW